MKRAVEVGERFGAGAEAHALAEIIPTAFAVLTTITVFFVGIGVGNIWNRFGVVVVYGRVAVVNMFVIAVRRDSGGIIVGIGAGGRVGGNADGGCICGS